MLLNYELTTNLKINTLMNLNKSKHFEESLNLKVSRSQLARELNVYRQTGPNTLKVLRRNHIVLEKVSLIPSMQ